MDNATVIFFTKLLSAALGTGRPVLNCSASGSLTGMKRILCSVFSLSGLVFHWEMGVTKIF